MRNREEPDEQSAEIRERYLEALDTPTIAAMVELFRANLSPYSGEQDRVRDALRAAEGYDETHPERELMIFDLTRGFFADRLLPPIEVLQLYAGHEGLWSTVGERWAEAHLGDLEGR